MLIGLKKQHAHPFMDKHGVAVSYTESGKVVGCGRVYPNKPIDVPDVIGKKILASNTIFEEVNAKHAPAVSVPTVQKVGLVDPVGPLRIVIPVVPVPVVPEKKPVVAPKKTFVAIPPREHAPAKKPAPIKKKGKK